MSHGLDVNQTYKRIIINHKMRFASILVGALFLMDSQAIRIQQEPIALSQEARMAKLKLKSNGEELKE